MVGLLPLQQLLYGLYVFLRYGVEEGIAHFDVVLQQDNHQVEVLVLNGRNEGGAVHGIRAVNVELIRAQVLLE